MYESELSSGNQRRYDMMPLAARAGFAAIFQHITVTAESGLGTDTELRGVMTAEEARIRTHELPITRNLDSSVPELRPRSERFFAG